MLLASTLPRLLAPAQIAQLEATKAALARYLALAALSVNTLLLVLLFVAAAPPGPTRRQQDPQRAHFAAPGHSAPQQGPRHLLAVWDVRRGHILIVDPVSASNVQRIPTQTPQGQALAQVALPGPRLVLLGLYLRPFV